MNQQAGMRILHICTDFWPNVGGIEKFVLELARESRLVGLSPSILCLNRVRQHPGALPARDEIEGIPIRRVPFVDLKYYKPAWLPMDELCGADVLHVHGTIAPLDFAAATQWRHGRPIVASTHGGIFHTTTLLPLKRFYFHTLQSPVHRRVAKYIACSQSDYELFRQVSDKVVLIENGVDLEPFLQTTQPPRLPESFISVSRLSANKRVDRLIRVFGELGRRGVGFSLRLLGPDPDQLTPRLQALAREEGVESQIQFVGPVSNEQLVDELSRASFFVSASQHEGFGISAIEAMAAGCLPILSDIPAFRYLLPDDLSPLLVDFSESRRAAEKIIQIQQMDQSSARKRVRSRAEAFSWKSRMPLWREVYEQAAR